MALVAVFMQGLAMFSDIGIRPGIVQNQRGDDPAFLNTAWTIQVVRGVALWLIACAGAYPFAVLYGELLLAWMIPVAALTALIAGFNSTSLATANRHLRLGRLTVLELIGQCASVVVMVVLAWLYGTVWALVAGGLTAAAVKMVLSHAWLGTIRNRPGWDAEAGRSLLRFGKWIFASTALTFLATKADRLVLGVLVPVEVLGVFSIALMFALLPAEIVKRLGHHVIFPMYSRVNFEPERLARIYDRSRRVLLPGGGMALAALFLAGPWLIGLLYDQRYAAAGWMVQVLAVGVWFQLMQATSGALLLALGEARWVAAANGAKAALLIPAVVAGHTLWGVGGALGGLVAVEVVKYVVTAAAVHGQRTGTPGPMRRLRGPVWLDLGYTGGAGAITAAAFVVMTLFDRHVGGDPGGVGVAAVGAGVVAAACLWAPALVGVRGRRGAGG
jgi:O-antigen/teichoic acid export membrane protein